MEHPVSRMEERRVARGIPEFRVCRASPVAPMTWVPVTPWCTTRWEALLGFADSMSHHLYFREQLPAGGAR